MEKQVFVATLIKGVPEPIAPVRVVVDFADHDCSNGDGTYPDLHSGCENFYVCHGKRVKKKDYY